MYKLITKNDNICLFQALLTDAVAVRVILPDILADYERKCPLCSSSHVHLRKMPDGSAEEDGFLN